MSGINLNESIGNSAAVQSGYAANVRLDEEPIALPRAKGTIEHRRAMRFFGLGGQVYTREQVEEAADRLVMFPTAEARWDATVVGLRLQPDPDSYEVVSVEETYNVITTAGRDFLHLQGYGTSGLGTNGLNYIALSNDTLTETSASTTLSTEIAANGLTRAQGTYAHTGGTNTTTIQKVFTATGAQSAQKAALFTASSSGTMNHALSFTQRTLANTDTLTITFTITLG
jgi:hypothetical protein